MQQHSICMVKQISIIYLITVIFLIHYYHFTSKNGAKHYYFQSVKSARNYFIDYPKVINSKRKILNQKTNDKRNIETAIAFTFGETKKMPKKIKLAYKKLCLIHLFSPSGIHLSSIGMIIFPIILLAKKRKESIGNLLEISINSLPFIITGLYPLKRIASIRFLEILLKKINIPFSMMAIFNIIYLADFFFGTYTKSPLSFIYSYLFLGIIIAITSSQKNTQQKIPFMPLILSLYLFGGQIIIQYFQGKPIVPLCIFIGSFLTSIFSFVFPLTLVWTFLPTSLFNIQLTYLSNILELPLNLYNNAVMYIADIFTKDFSLYKIDISWPIAVIFLSLPFVPIKTKKLFFLMFITILSNQLF